MTYAEKEERFLRSQRLNMMAIVLGLAASGSGLIGIIFWPILPFAAVLLIAAWMVGRHADRVSPYSGKTK